MLFQRPLLSLYEDDAEVYEIKYQYLIDRDLMVIFIDNKDQAFQKLPCQEMNGGSIYAQLKPSLQIQLK
jgi:hypothetical protein